ncbi:hypothetical protein LTF62_004594 [Salmonella enterica]|nr:hypothetical protein [Salmonella enterica]
MRKLIFLLILSVTYNSNAETLFFGDSLTYVIGNEYKNTHNEPTNIIYNVGFGFIRNNQYLFDYIDNIDKNRYSTIFIVLGTNDAINTESINDYAALSYIFLARLKEVTPKSKIVWLLPPALRDKEKDSRVKNVSNAIMTAGKIQHIETIEIQKILGTRYTERINGERVRTPDGIHITNYGAKLIVQTIK